MLRRRSRNETPSLVATASPSKITSPSSGSINRINNRAVVDLPQPLSPTRAFVPREQDEILARLHAYIVDQAMWIWVVHDLNPRAMSPKVKGFVQAQAWVQDLTPVYVAE